MSSYCIIDVSVLSGRVVVVEAGILIPLLLQDYKRRHILKSDAPLLKPADNGPSVKTVKTEFSTKK